MAEQRFTHVPRSVSTMESGSLCSLFAAFSAWERRPYIATAASCRNTASPHGPPARRLLPHGYTLRVRFRGRWRNPGAGLHSLTGNTWEWCSDWFSTDFHLTGPTSDPTGPPSGTAKVRRGGSFLCHKSYCNRYSVAARTQNTPDSASSHISFRCAKDLI